MCKSSEVRSKETTSRKEYYHSLSNHASSQQSNSKRVGNMHVKGKSSLQITEVQYPMNMPGRSNQHGRETKQVTTLDQVGDLDHATAKNPLLVNTSNSKVNLNQIS